MEEAATVADDAANVDDEVATDALLMPLWLSWLMSCRWLLYRCCSRYAANDAADAAAKAHRLTRTRLLSISVSFLICYEKRRQKRSCKD